VADDGSNGGELVQFSEEQIEHGCFHPFAVQLTAQLSERQTRPLRVIVVFRLNEPGCQRTLRFPPCRTQRPLAEPPDLTLVREFGESGPDLLRAESSLP